MLKEIINAIATYMTIIPPILTIVFILVFANKNKKSSNNENVKAAKILAVSILLAYILFLVFLEIYFNVLSLSHEYFIASNIRSIASKYDFFVNIKLDGVYVFFYNFFCSLIDHHSRNVIILSFFPLLWAGSAFLFWFLFVLLEWRIMLFAILIHLVFTIIFSFIFNTMYLDLLCKYSFKAFSIQCGIVMIIGYYGLIGGYIVYQFAYEIILWYTNKKDGL